MYHYLLLSNNFFPKYLEPREISDPTIALEGFFDLDKLQGHFERLKEWRDTVIGDYYWKGDRDNPAELFYLHQRSAGLIEALYIFYLAENSKIKFVNGKLPIDSSSEIIADERSNWNDYPKDLSDQELADPYIILQDVFSKFSLEKYLIILSEWLGSGLSIFPANEFVPTVELIATYEFLQKVYAVGFLFHKRKISNPLDCKIKISGAEAVFLQPLRPIKSDPSPSEMLVLNEIKNLMFRRVPSMQMMIHLGTHLPSLTFFILFLIDDDANTLDSNFSNKIEDQCRYLGNVQALVHKVSSAKTALDERRRFWINSFQNGTVVFKNPLLHIPNYDEVIVVNKDELIDIWKRWGEQGKSFFEGAKFYRAAGDHNLCLYLSQQSLEYALKAFILGITGYNVYMHNVPRLLRISTLVTGAFIEVFKIETQEGKAMLELLHGAAVITRHHNYPRFEPGLVDSTFHVVQELLKGIELMYQRFVSEL